MRRALGVDLGDKRIGLALADVDPLGRALALVTIRRSATPEADAAALRSLIEQNEVTDIVVGLPLEAAGASGPQARATKEWAAAIESELGLPVVLRDERLTSHLAEQRLGPMKRGRSGGPPTPTQRNAYRARVDREAAAIILQDELDSRANVAALPPLVPASPPSEPLSARGAGDEEPTT